jgi:hypothetical protein
MLMVEPLGDQDKDGMFGKRPARTIEGTATELSVTPSSGAELPHEPASDEPMIDEEPVGGAPDESAPAGTVEDAVKSRRKGPPPRTSPTELKGLFIHLAAGLIGGLVGVVALATAWGLLDRQQAAPQLGGIEQRLASLEARPQEPSQDAGAIAEMQTRIGALEERKPEPPAELASLNERIGKLEASLQSLAKAAQSGGSVADAAALDAKMTEIDQKLTAKVEQSLTEQNAARAKSIESVEADVATLKAKLGALAEAKLDQGETGGSEDLAAIDERVGKIETVLPKLAETVERGNAAAQSGAAAIAFANLRDAVDGGGTYSAQLDAFNAVAPEAGNLGVLPARAERGIPTLPQLALALQGVDAQTAPASKPAADASFFDSVIASAKSAVQVRRLDAGADGSDPEAVLTRAEQQVAKGDLAAAMKEVEALPDSSREAFTRWLDDARARVSADETLADLEGTLLASIGGKPEEAKP